MRFRLASLMALLATAAFVNATTIINATGPSPFGFGNASVLVTAWTQGAVYTNVSITMPLRDDSPGLPIGGVEGTVYLTTQIGPGTTTSDQVAPPITISGLFSSFTPRTLFSGLTLAAGNYYIVLVPTKTFNVSMSPEGPSNAVITTGTAVTFLGAGNTPQSPAAYPPATNITLGTAEGSFFITVTGDPAGPLQTPEPSSLILTLTAIGSLGIYHRRKLRLSPHRRRPPTT
jgi:hypothetical protein